MNMTINIAWPGRWAWSLLSPPGRRARLSILIFHRVLRAPDPLLPQEPTVAQFEARMRWVAARFNVLPLASAVQRLQAGELPPRALAITFDDGYADNATLAAPILQRLQLPATVFVAPGYLDGGVMFNDLVQAAVSQARGPRLDLNDFGLGVFPLPDLAARRAAFQTLCGKLKPLPSQRRQALAHSIARRVRARVSGGLMLSRVQLRGLPASGLSIGAHTMTHPILARLPVDDARREIVDSRRTLESLLQTRITLFAYPNGRPHEDYTGAHVALVREAGFRAAVTTARGAARVEDDPWQLPRFTPWDAALWRFGARLAGNLVSPQALTV